MTKKCRNCWYCATFYAKGYCNFYRAGCGYCGKENKVKQDDEVCDCWRTRSGFRRRVTKPMVLQALEKGLTNIAALQQIFAESEEEKRESEAKSKQ